MAGEVGRTGVTEHPNPAADGAGWGCAAPDPSARCFLSPVPSDFTRRVSCLCHLCPTAALPAPSSDLLLPPGGRHTWPHRLSHQVTSQNPVAHLPLRAGPALPDFLDWNSPLGRSTDNKRIGQERSGTGGKVTGKVLQGRPPGAGMAELRGGGKQE